MAQHNTLLHIYFDTTIFGVCPEKLGVNYYIYVRTFFHYKMVVENQNKVNYQRGPTQPTGGVGSRDRSTQPTFMSP